MAKRKTKRQKIAAQKQSERMKKYWAQKRAADEKSAQKIGDFMDNMKKVRPILDKVYMAGWHRNKAEIITPDDVMISVEQAYLKISDIFRP